MSDSTGGPQGELPEQPEQPRRPAYGQYGPGGPPPPSGPRYGPPSGPRYGSPPGGRSPDDPDGRPVTVGQAFSWAWATFARSAGAWVGAALVVLAIAVAASILLTPDLRVAFENADDPDVLIDLLQAGATVTDLLLSAVLAAVNIVLGSVLVHGALAATRQGTVRFGDFFALRNVGGIVMLGVIEAALTFVLSFAGFFGSVLSLVIGFFLAAALFFVVDKEQDAVTAIRSSVVLVRANVGITLLTIVVAAITAFVGFLLCFVGALVSVPVAALTGAFVYRRLLGERPAAPA